MSVAHVSRKFSTTPQHFVLANTSTGMRKHICRGAVLSVNLLHGDEDIGAKDEKL